MSRDAVEANNKKFMEAVRNKDAKALATRYTKDCVLLPNLAPRMEGPGAVEAFFSQAFDAGIHDIRLTTDDVIEAGDTVIEIGTVGVTVALPDGGTMEDPGKYVVVYRQEDGDWKMAVDIWNTDQAPQG